MRSINARFRQFKKIRKGASDYVIFARSVRYQKLSRKQISLSFNKLVPQDQYQEKDRKKLITHLYRLSKQVEDGENEGNFDHTEAI